MSFSHWSRLQAFLRSKDKIQKPETLVQTDPMGAE